MGVMRFLIEPPELLGDWPELFRAYISGFDGRVHPTRVELDGPVMACRRQSSDSGKLHVAVPLPGFGRPMVTTTSLPERDEPFLLAVELARGKISQLRDQLAGWEMGGMAIPAAFRPLHQQAQRLFGRAAASQSDPVQASRLAHEALALAFQAADLLARAYMEQRLTVRRRRAARLPAALGCSLGRAVPGPPWEHLFCQAFTAAAIPLLWRQVEPEEGTYRWELYDEQVEWCHNNRLLIYGGPLLDLSPDGMPGWLWQWSHDFLNLQSFVCDFVETALTRYLGKIRHWEISSRANTGGALTLSEENRLTLVARTLEIARQVDQDLQLTIRIDQPWGEYQARGQHRLSPLQFVDALVRSGIGLSGIHLEIAVGYRPRGSALRDLLDFSRLIDQWSGLGLPLHVTLAFPSAGGPDTLSTKPDLEVDSPQWRSDWSGDAQAEWADLYLPMLMAKQPVVGIYWTHFADAAPHLFPHAGLLAPDGTPKPALEHITRYRQTYW